MSLPSFDEAQQMIRDPSLPWMKHVEAASVITATKDVSYDDVLACLRIRGLPSEWAACRLYVLTRRPRKDTCFESFSMNFDDWQSYLRDELHVV